MLLQDLERMEAVWIIDFRKTLVLLPSWIEKVVFVIAGTAFNLKAKRIFFLKFPEYKNYLISWNLWKINETPVKNSSEFYFCF